MPYFIEHDLSSCLNYAVLYTKSQIQINAANLVVRNKNTTFLACLPCKKTNALLPSALPIFSSSRLNIFLKLLFTFFRLVNGNEEILYVGDEEDDKKWEVVPVPGDNKVQLISYKRYLECTLLQWRLPIYP